MGACASVSKQFKSEEAMPPAPEVPKEETVGEVTEVKAQEEEQKPEVVVDDKPSLGSLLSESDEVTKDTTTVEKEAQPEEEIPSVPVEKEESPKVEEEEEKKEEEEEEEKKAEEEKSTEDKKVETPEDKAAQ